MDLRLALSVLVAAGLLSACGGTDDGGDAAGNGAGNALAVDAAGPSGPDDAADAGDTTDPIDEKALSPAAAAALADLVSRLPPQLIPERYIVTFRPGIFNPTAEADGMVRGLGGRVHFAYSRVLSGFAATLPPAAVEALRRSPLIESIEPDQPVILSQTAPLEQTGATWGLDRIDQALGPLSTTYRYGGTGAGVTAFIIDTGIRATHTDFLASGTGISRVAGGYTAIADGNGTGDCNGHGTHVAGTVGGLRWGVAKDVTLVPVRVLDCNGSGSWSGVIAGLDFVARSTARPAVANLSLGGGASAAVDTAVRNAVAAGVSVVVAAGNSNANACNASPAREPLAVTVGATTSTDARSSFSNFGTCLDLFAPGSAITSAVNTSDVATATYNGTSMASPHVAGTAALILAQQPSLTPQQVSDRLIAQATTGRLTAIGTGSPNRLLFTNPDGIELPTVSVLSLTATRAVVRNGWRATVTVTVKNGQGQTVAGALVRGRFTVGGTAVSCTTAATGRCSVTTGTIATRTTSTTYSVTGISGNQMTYDPAANTVSSLAVARP
jgi:hypothetical protein